MQNFFAEKRKKMRGASRILYDNTNLKKPSYLTAQQNEIARLSKAGGFSSRTAQGFDEVEDDDDPNATDNPDYFKKRSRVRQDHKNDKLRGTVAAKAAADLEKLTDKTVDFTISNCIDQIEQEVFGEVDIKIYPIIDAGQANSPAPDAASGKAPKRAQADFELPSIFNGPIMMRERKALLMAAFRQLLTHGYAVVAINAGLMDYSLRHIKNELKADPRLLRVPKQRDMLKTVPCEVMAADNFEVRAYRCAKTDKIEWRAKPISENATDMRIRGYRFAVYVPENDLAKFAPTVAADGSIRLRSPVQACKVPFLNYMDKLATYNRVITQNSLQKFLLKQVIEPLSTNDMTPEQRARHAQQQQQFTNQQNGVRSAHSNSSGLLSFNLPALGSNQGMVQIQAPPMVTAKTAVAMVDFARSNLSHLNQPTTHSNSHRNAAAPDASFLDPLSQNAKTLDSMDVDSALQIEFASRVAPLDTQETVNRQMAQLPANYEMANFIPAQYLGEDPEALKRNYEDAVHMSFHLSRALSGYTDAKMVSKKSSSPLDGDALAPDTKKRNKFVKECQRELSGFVEWMYYEVICWFDKRALVDILERENKFLGVSHNKLVQLVQEFEYLQLQNDNLVEEADRTMFDVDEMEVQRKERDTAQKNAADYKLSADEMRSIKQKLKFSLESYRQATNYLVYLTMCLHSSARLSVLWS